MKPLRILVQFHFLVGDSCVDTNVIRHFISNHFDHFLPIGIIAAAILLVPRSVASRLN